ncbi:hypothetical protein F4860DRAFT_519387 [Xylaria cubensis]|nr:hypothetical protein F4860DRAFT_519387 [Xylaria cubensis]
MRYHYEVIAIAGRLAIAGVLSERTHNARGAKLVTRENCNAGQLVVYRTGDRFICVEKTVFWTGVALTSGAASQFATWVVNKFTGEPTANEGKRNVNEKQAKKWFENEATVTCGWTPTLAARYEVSLHIHNMTVTYSKDTGS